MDEAAGLRAHRSSLPNGKNSGGGSTEATVIAWIWARTVKCPNPACGCEMPLVRSFTLSKKKGKEAYIEPEFHDGTFSCIIKTGKHTETGTVSRKGAVCPCCGSAVSFSYVREESCAGRMSAKMLAIVAEGAKGRIYLAPNEEHIATANVEKPGNYPEGELAYYPGHLNTKVYGLKEFHQLFTNRQLTALTTSASWWGRRSGRRRQTPLPPAVPPTPLRSAKAAPAPTPTAKLWGCIWRLWWISWPTKRMLWLDGAPMFNALLTYLLAKLSRWFGIMQNPIHFQIVQALTSAC